MNYLQAIRENVVFIIPQTFEGTKFPPHIMQYQTNNKLGEIFD